MTKRTEFLGVRLTPEEKRKLRRLAEQEERTMSQEARKVIKEHLAKYDEATPCPR